MLIVCPDCTTEYDVDPAELGADGRAIRCATCGLTWMAQVPEGAPTAVPALGDRPSALPSPSRLALRRRRIRLPVPAWPAAFAALMAAHAALFIWREPVVRVLPQTASIYAALGLPVNLRGLTFSEIKTSTELQDGVPVLAVEGVVTNVGERPAPLPKLQFALANGIGRDIYAWDGQPGKPTLAAGEMLHFRSKLAAPPADGRTLTVRFQTARDQVAALTPRTPSD